MVSNTPVSRAVGLGADIVQNLVRQALTEDAPWGDITAEAFLRPGLLATLHVQVKRTGVICGLPVAEAVFRQVDPNVVWEARVGDGAEVTPGDIVAEVRGDAQALLKGERTALNFLQRMSGVASLTADFVAAVRSSSEICNIADTRKTTPGLRHLEKYAVRCGGGVNHRYGLSDGVLVKDNHLAYLRREGYTMAQAVAEARRRLPHLYRVEIEVESLDQVREALDAGADALLLDNMSLDNLRASVALAEGRNVLLEASGNMTLDRVPDVAKTGVHLISVGALTHSAPALDISLDWKG